MAFNHLFTFVNYSSLKTKLLNQRYNMQHWIPVYDFKTHENICIFRDMLF